MRMRKPPSQTDDSGNNDRQSRTHSGYQNSFESSCFNFVAMDPSTPRDSQVRTLIRSNAGRHVWRHRGGGSEREGVGMVLTLQPNSNKFNVASNAKSNLSSELDAEEEDSVYTQRLTRPESLTNGIHHGLKSPFGGFPTKIPEDTAHRFFNYASTVVLTKMFLHAPGMRPGEPADIWPCKARRLPALFSAYVYANAAHDYALQRLHGRVSEAQRWHDWFQMRIAENEAIREINKALGAPDKTLCEELIMAVFLMGFSHYDEEAFANPGPRHKSVLRNLQWGNVYSFLDTDAVHLEGLCRMIALRGGVDTLELNGLPQMLSLGAVMLSSKFLVKPIFPYIPIVCTNGPRVQPGWPTHIEHLLKMYDGGNFTELLGLEIPHDLVNILRDMYTYSVVIDMYALRVLTDLNLPELADRRNSIQHRILSLPTAQELVDWKGKSMYESLRLAAIAYSLLTIFPLAPRVAPFSHLTHLLKQSLGFAVQDQWKAEPQILIWILVTGGIAAGDVDTIHWFASSLVPVVEGNKIRSWSDLKEVLTSVMWVDSICDEAAEELWSTILQVRKVG